ncbi:hypothetical protein C0V72_06415 [Porphyrobacter sp. TH134]|uniref:ATP-binding cassette domain-containing protein n=1 Tax=Porphyrobacter sp. TH134 TaxID=2067450 RepID=UPI000C7DDE8B|nr:ABC transporter ATP-binding protein [Porphyrobacter sp. TH134]PLK24011.1 hypothetical protein C0V72_06415 [Porphyrobacter sp. TH134]
MSRSAPSAEDDLPSSHKVDALRTTRELIARVREVSANSIIRILALMMLGAVFDSAGLLLLLPILSILVEAPAPGGLSGWLDAAGFSELPQQLAVLLAAFVIAGLLRAQVAHARDTSVAAFQADFAMTERADLIGRIAATRWADIALIGHARVANAVVTDIDRASSAVYLLLRIAIAALTLITLLAVAVSLSAQLTLLAGIMFVLGAAFVGRNWRGALSLGSGARRAMLAMHATTAGFMDGLKTAMSENSQGVFLRQAGQILEQARANAVNQQVAQSRSRRLFTSATTLFAAALVGGGVMLGIPTTTLIAVIIVIARMAAPTLLLQQTIQSYLFALPSFAAIRSLHAEIGRQPPALQNAADASLAIGPIRFDKAVYRHHPGGGVGPISLVIHPGQIVGIQGASGSGKTTFLDLLTGLIEPQAGTVTVGAIAPYGAEGAAWRSTLAYQSQSTFQINDTVRANLLLSGAAGLADADMWRALELVCMDDIVRRLPGGLDGTMGEVGATLSGGERQRIALARGLLRRPQVLILDEALAAVDIPAEHRILGNIRKAMPGLTMVIVAHRPESLALCDTILTFRQGLIVGDPSSG